MGVFSTIPSWKNGNLGTLTVVEMNFNFGKPVFKFLVLNLLLSTYKNAWAVFLFFLVKSLIKYDNLENGSKF